MTAPISEDNQVVAFGTKEFVELFIVIPIFSLIFLLFIFKFDDYFPDIEQMKGPIIFFVFGLFHVFASNILAILYNTTYIVLQIGPILKPSFLKMLGCVVIGFSVISGVKAL